MKSLLGGNRNHPAEETLVLGGYMDEVTVEDFGWGCKIVGVRNEGETDHDVEMRYARKIYLEDEARKERAAERRRFRRALDRWEPKR